MSTVGLSIGSFSAKYGDCKQVDSTFTTCMERYVCGKEFVFFEFDYFKLNTSGDNFPPSPILEFSKLRAPHLLYFENNKHLHLKLHFGFNGGTL